MFPFHDAHVYGSDAILVLHDIPRKLLVVGGGAIGCESAPPFNPLATAPAAATATAQSE